jgi:periplasmic protein TonB
MKLTLGLNSKMVVFFVLLLVFSNKGFSQGTVKDAVLETQNARNFGDVEVKPEFKGGIERFYKYVANNYHTSDAEPSGTMKANFIIDIDGCLTNIEIVKNEVGIISANEFIRVLQNCPRWIPGFDNGKPVRVMSYVPITLQSGYKKNPLLNKKRI